MGERCTDERATDVTCSSEDLATEWTCQREAGSWDGGLAYNPYLGWMIIARGITCCWKSQPCG